jgi:hypothetical protein
MLRLSKDTLTGLMNLGIVHTAGAIVRDIPCLVDASDVRAVNALKTPPAWSISATAMLRQQCYAFGSAPDKLGYHPLKCLRRNEFSFLLNGGTS